ncbi:MAG: MFS transporter, partial [bacterium]|nr:MFS transporter [bacterium]
MLILAAILAILVYGMIAALLGTALPALAESFQLGPDREGIVALAQGLGLAVASISVGPLIDNKGKKTGLVLGLGLVALALFAVPNAFGFGTLLSSWFVLGIGGGIIVTGANALVSDVNPARRATVLNFLNLFFGLGGMSTPFIVANFLGGDIIMMCYLLGGMTTVALLVHLIAPIPPPSGERGFKFSETGSLISQPALYLLAAYLFLYVACEVGVWNWLVRHLVAQGLEEARAQNILSLGFALGLLVGRVAVAPILIKIKPQTVTLAAAVLMSGTTYMMLRTTDPTWAGVAIFCAGLAMAPVFPTTLAMVGNAFPKATATAMGIVITSGWIGLVVSSPVIGSIAGDDPKNLQTALLVLPA